MPINWKLYSALQPLPTSNTFPPFLGIVNASSLFFYCGSLKKRRKKVEEGREGKGQKRKQQARFPADHSSHISFLSCSHPFPTKQHAFRCNAERLLYLPVMTWESWVFSLYPSRPLRHSICYIPSIHSGWSSKKKKKKAHYFFKKNT